MKIPGSLETRRSFLLHSGSLIGLAALSSPLLLPGCLEKGEKAGEVTATEDLMREHGVLQRLLLIFADLYRVAVKRRVFVGWHPCVPPGRSQKHNPPVPKINTIIELTQWYLRPPGGTRGSPPTSKLSFDCNSV